MNFEFLPLRVTRFQGAILLIAMVVGGFRAIYSVWSGGVWDVIFSASMALAAGFGWWWMRNRPPLWLRIDDSELRLSRAAATITLIPWDRVERLCDEITSIAVYYKDIREPRLLVLRSSRFRSGDWDQIRSLILSKVQIGEEGEAPESPVSGFDPRGGVSKWGLTAS